MGRPPGTTEVGDRRKLQILQRAEDLLVAGSFREMTMDSIAESIGIAKSTLYHYFPRKDDILASLMSTTLVSLIESCRRRQDTPMSAVHRIYELMVDVMELTATSPGRARALYDQKQSLAPEHQDQITTLERQYFAMIAATVQEAIAAGELRETDPTIAAHAVTGLVAHSRHWYSPNGRYTPREVAYTFWHYFVHGAGAAANATPT